MKFLNRDTKQMVCVCKTPWVGGLQEGVSWRNFVAVGFFFVPFHACDFDAWQL